MGHTLKKGSRLEKRVTIGKKIYTWKNRSQLEKVSHLKIVSHVEKRVKLEKMGHT